MLGDRSALIELYRRALYRSQELCACYTSGNTIVLDLACCSEIARSLYNLNLDKRALFGPGETSDSDFESTFWTPIVDFISSQLPRARAINIASDFGVDNAGGVATIGICVDNAGICTPSVLVPGQPVEERVEGF